MVTHGSGGGQHNDVAHQHKEYAEGKNARRNPQGNACFFVFEKLLHRER
jgi:hypothetical protein